MGSLVWVLNLWGMRLAAGAAVLATMGAYVAMHQQADAAKTQLQEVAKTAKQDAAEVWAVLD